MTNRLEPAFNSSLALYVAIAGGLLFVALLCGLYLMPEETARAIDHINIKILIAAIGVAAITASCAVIYFVYHTPSDVRAAYLTWRANVVVFFVGTGYSVFGWPKTEAITINREVGWDVSFSLASVAGDVAWVIGVCAAALLLTTILFVIVWRTQKQSGSEA